MDEGLEQGVVDLPQPQHAQPGAKRMEDTDIGYFVEAAQPGKGSPSRLLGEQRDEQVYRMCRGQEG